MSQNEHRTIIVGGGMAGLTAAAYLSRAGHNVLLLEKNKECGGLLSSFHRDGFTFDAGARSILNSGIIQPMLNELGIELELLDSPVSIGVENDIISLDSETSLDDYKGLLDRLYPESVNDVDKIISKIEGIIKDMAILYGIDNPNFRDLKSDRNYLIKELLPWLGRFIFTLYRMNRKNEPVESYLGKLSSNQSLIDIIAQHFFKMTPTFFALGYFYAYNDYRYPRGGTGELPKAMVQKIIEWDGRIQTGTEITEVNLSEKKVIDRDGNMYSFDSLIWSADLKTLYRILDIHDLDEKVTRKILKQKELLLSKRGCDSVYSMYIGVDMPLESFNSISNGHFFYTPSKKGLGEVHKSELNSLIEDFETKSREEILRWLDEYCQLTTYEISIPAFRDPALAPEGKTGLIISMLFEYDLMKRIKDANWYEEFRIEIENRMLDTLSNSVYPGLKEKVIFQSSSTPLSIATIAGSSEGAIVGWSYESPVPVVHNLRKIASSAKTPIPNVYQAGQWAYSPAGIPTAILTGWYAARNSIKSKK
ncbi:MAG: NAD(P)/FAD-dependent oxidoreductase [Candidatus Thorarchaeota archaeon]|nr:MAG: NAD(P)/FAD-dependent oxidoreductase [Candidatus Thorarchaeota archaeon]